MIYELLKTGAANAIKGCDLAIYFNCDIRMISDQVERERREGKPICATSRGSNSGYYIAADEKELKDYCDRLHHRAAELYKTRAALLQVLKNYADNKGGAEDGRIRSTDG